MSLHVRDDGAGEVVVLVHGLGASHRVFDAVIARGGRRYLAVDLPRSGKSLRWAESEPVDVARKLHNWLSARGISRFHLVGHSFGGLVALSLAAANPASVSSLTVASAPALGLPAEAKALLATGALDVAARWAARLPVSKRVMGGYLRWMRGGGPVPPEAMSLYAESAAADGYFPGMADALRSIASYRLPVDALRGAPFRTTVL
ncbi:MAG: alpha/beta fold hydrolase, partial [Archangium sp.]|nr:alpha/beta fold hydrolase [Archangium sp.]